MNKLDIRQKPGFYIEKSRAYCVKCLQSTKTCYCKHIKPFDPKIHFVILTHTRERQKRIGTGRMAHLCLENSTLIEGYDFQNCQRVNAILQNSSIHSVILFPGENSLDIGNCSRDEKATLFPKSKSLAVFVLDGTWSTAPKILQQSKNLWELPRISFQPTKPSRYRVRAQPKEYCFSTVEAIHQTIEHLGPLAGSPNSREHDTLISAFDHMVETQIDYQNQPKLKCLWKPPKVKKGTV
jgi:DTW domain-containing protein